MELVLKQDFFTGLIYSGTPSSQAWEQAEGWGLLLIQDFKKRKKKKCVVHFFVLKGKMTSVPVRAIQVDVSAPDAYSLESVGKHGFCECRQRLFVHDRAIIGSQ